MTKPEPLMTQKEVAEQLRVSERTLLCMRQRGELAYIKIGSRVLYEPREIRDFKERNTFNETNI